MPLKPLRIFVIAIAVCIMAFSLSFALEKPIGHLLKDKSPVKVFIAEAKNESGQSQIPPEVFKNSLEQALLQRKLLKFEIVNNISESDIQISAVIKSYRYLKHGPVNLIPGLSIFLDVAATVAENFAEMKAEYTITDTKSNNVLWNSPVTERLKKVMTPDESIPLICAKLSKTFVWRCFGRSEDLTQGGRGE